MKRYRLGKIIAMFIVFAPLLVFIFGSIVMLLWNNALAPVLHISTVTFWQALGILVLSKILFSSFGRGGGRRYPMWRQRMQQKWNDMTQEEREKFKQRCQDRWWKGDYKPWDSEKGNVPANPAT